jgi:hypothetical protein
MLDDAVNPVEVAGERTPDHTPFSSNTPLDPSLASAPWEDPGRGIKFP